MWVIHGQIPMECERLKKKNSTLCFRFRTGSTHSLISLCLRLFVELSSSHSPSHRLTVSLTLHWTIKNRPLAGLITLDIQCLQDISRFMLKLSYLAIMVDNIIGFVWQIKE
jgi:hypothetical protein